MAELESSILAGRRRGYAFHKEWEGQAAALKSEWPGAKQQAQRLLEGRIRTLTHQVHQVEQVLGQAAGNHALLSSLDGQLDNLTKEIEAAGKAVTGQIAAVNAGVSAIHLGLEQADFMLGIVESGVVKLFPDECGVAACSANMVLGKKENDEGVLLLTDKRLIFIHEEERVLKKVLFIVTEKETIRTLRWSAPIGAVNQLAAEDKGGFLGFGEKELLTIDFDDEAKEVPKKVVMHLTEGTENEEWRSLIMRVKTGDIESERVSSAKAEANPAPASTPVPHPHSLPGLWGQPAPGLQRHEPHQLRVLRHRWWPSANVRSERFSALRCNTHEALKRSLRTYSPHPNPTSNTSTSGRITTPPLPSAFMTFSSWSPDPSGRLSQRETMRPSARTHGELSLVYATFTRSGTEPPAGSRQIISPSQSPSKTMLPSVA